MAASNIARCAASAPAVEFCNPRLAAIRSPLAAADLINNELLLRMFATLLAIVCELSCGGVCEMVGARGCFLFSASVIEPRIDIYSPTKKDRTLAVFY